MYESSANLPFLHFCSLLTALHTSICSLSLLSTPNKISILSHSGSNIPREVLHDTPLVN